MIPMSVYQTAADCIRSRAGEAELAVVLGSGLGGYEEKLEDAVFIPYQDIPGFPLSTVAGHAGRFAVGTLFGKRVMVMCGRFHSYEGYEMGLVTMPVRVMRLLGVKTLILTNAAGGVNEGFKPGDLMLIEDYLNFSGRNPLRGPNMEEFGPRFPDMSEAYAPALRECALRAAEKLGLSLQKGVYCWFNGPTYETPAEIRMARVLGADAVGMSTVPETIVAHHAGMKVLGISTITNMAAGIKKEKINHAEVMEIGRRVKSDFTRLMDQIIADIPKEG